MRSSAEEADVFPLPRRAIKGTGSAAVKQVRVSDATLLGHSERVLKRDSENGAQKPQTRKKQSSNITKRRKKQQGRKQKKKKTGRKNNKDKKDKNQKDDKDNNSNDDLIQKNLV